MKSDYKMYKTFVKKLQSDHKTIQLLSYSIYFTYLNKIKESKFDRVINTKLLHCLFLLYLLIRKLVYLQAYKVIKKLL